MAEPPKSERRSLDHTAYKYWSRMQFGEFRRCIAYLETVDKKGDIGIGTAFHVGDGVFVTARHVVEGRTIREIGFDDIDVVTALSIRSTPLNEHWVARTSVIDGPHFHQDSTVDVACFRANYTPDKFVQLGGHLDDLMTQYEFVLYRTLVIGYPPIPLTGRPVLVASCGEVNAQIEKRTGRHPHFIISTIARGGFSGAPVLVAYDEDNPSGGTALLGLVTESLTDGRDIELGYMAVLTIEPIYDCLKQHGLLPAYQAFTPPE